MSRIQPRSDGSRMSEWALLRTRRDASYQGTRQQTGVGGAESGRERTCVNACSPYL